MLSPKLLLHYDGKRTLACDKRVFLSVYTRVCSPLTGRKIGPRPPSLPLHQQPGGCGSRVFQDSAGNTKNAMSVVEFHVRVWGGFPAPCSVLKSCCGELLETGAGGRLCHVT